MKLSRCLLATATIPLLLAGGALSGCSSQKTKGPAGQLEIQVSESPKITMDPDLARTSDALHSYLVGQLAYDSEDFGRAAESFSKAGELAWEPVPKIHSTLAELLLKQEKLEEALDETEKALKDNPNLVPLLLLRAGLFESLGRPREALAVYANIQRIDKSSVDAVYLSALLHGTMKQVEVGIDELEEFLKVNPSSLLARYLLAVLYEENGELSRAQRELREISKKNPDNISVRFDELRVLLKARDRSAAASVAQAILDKRAAASVVAAQMLQAIVSSELPPGELLKSFQLFAPGGIDPRDLRLKLALAHVQEQKFGDAIRDLSIVLAQDPNYSIARYYRASIFGGAGRKKEAYQDLFAIKPGQELFVKSRTFAAFLMKQEKDFAGAERAVRQALEAEPDNKSIFAYLILILRDGKRYEEALSLLKKELKKEPNSERLLFNKGIIYNDLGRMGDAVEAMEQVIEVDPNHADALNFVAYAQAEEGKDLDRAEALVKRALALSPQDGFYLDTLGWIYYQRQNFALAADTLQKAAELSSGDVVVSEHFGDALVKVGRFSEASEVYRTALEKGRDQEPSERSGDVEEAIARLEEKVAKLAKEHPELAPVAPLAIRK